MILWLDAQLSPSLADWISQQFQGVVASPVRALGLRDAEDREIFNAAREAGAVIMSKDRDFVQLLDMHGPPPQIIWVTCGNTSNREMRKILSAALPEVIKLVESGEHLVEISDL
ncbi:MAG: hypothetical protein GF372_00010 [Candidatus Marinimicrobia bacterium]|nr:hypothetical protein [Candidatus Neomarinimicrobiota bacterium]